MPDLNRDAVAEATGNAISPLTELKAQQGRVVSRATRGPLAQGGGFSAEAPRYRISWGWSTLVGCVAGAFCFGGHLIAQAVQGTAIHARAK